MTTGLLYSTAGNDNSGMNYESNLLQVDPDDDEGDTDYDETPNLTPLNNIQITVNDDEKEGDDDENKDDEFGFSFGLTHEGVVTRIVDGTTTYEANEVKISKTLFKNDTTFEAKTYDYSQLFKLLGDKLNNNGTISDTAVIRLRNMEGDNVDFMFKDILQIDYPRTWLDIFNKLVPNNSAVINATDAEKPVQLLVALQTFQDNYNQELYSEVEMNTDEDEEDLTIMSPLMRKTIKEQILRILMVLREKLPNNYQIYLELGDFYYAESLFNKELEVYMLAISRGVDDTKGEIASRLGRFYLEVLDLPNQALASFNKIKFWFCTKTNKHFASELIPPKESPFKNEIVEDIAKSEDSDVNEEPVIFKPPSAAALASAVLKVKALIAVKEYIKAINLIYSLRGLFNKIADAETDDSALQNLIPLDTTLESFVHECEILLGLTHFKLGELYFAEKEYLKVPPESKFYIVSRINLCQIYYYQKRYDDLNRMLSILRQDDPLYRVASQINKIGDPSADPEDFNPYESMPDNISYNHDYSKALCLTAMTLLAYDFRNNRAFDLTNLPPPRRRQVVQYAVKAMHYDPMNFEPYLIIAEFTSRSTDVDIRNQTENWLNRALALSPNNPIILYKLAFYYATSKDLKVKSFDKARETLRKILEFAPDFTDAYILLGEMHYKLAEWKISKDFNEATEHFKNAKNYFNNALMLSPERIDVRMKLGYCYMNQIETIKSRIQKLWSQHQDIPENKEIKDQLMSELGSLQQLLDKANNLFDIEKLTKPYVIDVLTVTDSGTPQVILSKGTDSGVDSTLLFKVRNTDGYELTLKPWRINSLYTTTEVQGYKTDPDVPSAVLNLQSIVNIGSKIEISKVIHPKMLKNKNLPDFTLHDDYVVEAWAATGYILFNLDFVEGYRAQLMGMNYKKGKHFDDAEEILNRVKKYCETYMSGKANIPAYIYAISALEEIERNKKLIQWSEEFKREITGQKTNALGNQWVLNDEKDPHLFFNSLADRAGLTIYTEPNDFCSGDITTITKPEDEIVFVAIEMLCNVRKASLMPRIGELQYGFILEVINRETDTLIGSLTVRIRPIDKKIIVISKDDKKTESSELALPERNFAASNLKLRLERRFVDKMAKFYLVIDNSVEVEIDNVPNYLKTQVQASGNNTLNVGLSFMGTKGKPLTFDVNKINIIRQIIE